MPIAAGSHLGAFEILSLLGAGGMGEVYKARDTRLERIVAIKVLPAHLADNPELRERFEREAKTIAGLNHPHICTLYDVGRQDGIDFLVMEYLEGETLAMRLLKGPLPLEQVLRYAIEISDALDKAHRKGVTHRDIKPGNVMLIKSGTKLLDFGLAKLKQAAVPAAMPVSQMPTLSQNPTIAGTLLGTVQYMAPEQVEGKVDEIDGRTDIFAFGAVVHEMATGRKAFEGKSSASVLGAIMVSEPPPISSLQPMTPPALDRVVKKCLRKDQEERWQSARDVTDELKWIAEGGSQAVPRGGTAPVVASRKSPLSNARVAWSVAAVLLVSGLALGALTILRRAPAESQAVRFSVGPPERGSFSPNPMFLTVSPDGSKLAFIAADSSGESQLWIRPLDSEAAQPLPGTDNPIQPFWSADSRFLAFYAEGKLKKIAVSGGPAQTLAESSANTAGAWSREGVVLFGSAGAAGTVGIMIRRVSAAGGAATPVTTLDASRKEDGHYWPHFLPDGNHFLYFARSTNPENNAIYAASLDSPEKKLLLNAMSNVVYVPPGYLLFNREGTLMAQPFDAERIELTGEAVPIVEDLQFNLDQGRTAFAASENGVLAYRTGAAAVQNRLVWASRNGTEQPVAAAARSYGGPRLSPDGRWVAVSITDQTGQPQVWLYDLARDTSTRLTFEGSFNNSVAWTPDGKRIALRSNRQGPRNIFWQMADGSGGVERLTTSEYTQFPNVFSTDGQLLVFSEIHAATGYDIWVLRLADRKAQPFLRTPAEEGGPRFSPDGRWLAYSSDESGRREVYVQPYPGPGGKWLISTEGGREAVWNRNGRELFYRNGDKMMAVDVTMQPTFSASKPRVLFEGRYLPAAPTAPAYDVSVDGQRFLMLKAGEQETSTPQVNVVVNWIEDMKQRMPAAQ